jgi:ubiquinone/menaquinone biosynthesis C-methylase UbiE
MAASPQIEEARRKSKELWDSMAPGWESRREYLWEVTRAVGEWMVAKIDPQPGQTILEIAAGAGDTGLAAARLLGQRGRLISTDFAPEMVEIAKRRAKELGVGNAEFRALDAEHNDLPDASVDGVLCRWAYMLMLDPAAAMAHTRRILRPGGKVAFSVWGRSSDNPWATLVGRVLVARGLLEPPDPKAPGGVFSLADHDDIRTLVTGAAFRSLEIEEIPVRWRFDDFDTYWGFVTDTAGAIAQLLEGLPPAELEAVRAGALQAAEPFRAGAGYAFPGLTVNAVAG